jgi:integrase
VRVRAGGSKTYHVQYDLHGRTRKVSGGRVAVMKEPQAREWARKILARVKLGEDPAGDKAEDRVKGKDTVGRLIEVYLERRQRELRPRSFLEVKRHLLSHASPLHLTPISKLDRRTIAGMLMTIESKSGKVAANRVRSSLMAFMGWCVGSGYIETNPVDYTPKAAENGARERLHSDDEVHAIWRALGDAPYSAIVKLLMLLGLRRTEIGGLRWDEIDFESATITLPAERTKAKHKFVVPLPDAALKVIGAQSGRGKREHVFGLRDTGFSGWSGGKAELDAKLSAAGYEFAHWTLHDFRRAISTTMNERLGVRPEVVEVILGHVVPGIAGVYNKAEYVEERRRALDKWADHVLSASSRATYSK